MQLKVIDAIIPKCAAVVDESAEQIYSGKWVHITASSSIPPSPQILYQIHAVYSDDDSERWLHTHGLARCGLPELEILDAPKENMREIGDIINTVACRMLHETEVPEIKEPLFIARFSDNYPLVCTFVP